MNRIIQANINSKSGTTKNQMDSFLENINNQLSNENNIFEKKTNNILINDEKEYNFYKIILNINFIYAENANDFHLWLKNEINNNLNIIEDAETKIHDCMHGNDKNQPCMIGDIWKI